MVGAVPLPPDYVGIDMVIASLVANVEAMISAERESAALKQLQVSYYVFKYRMLILWKNMSQSFYKPHLTLSPHICVMFFSGPETNDRLFIHCPRVCKLSDQLLFIVNKHWVFPKIILILSANVMLPILVVRLLFYGI